MTALEFFEAVRKSLKETESSDPVGAMYFIQDMEELFEKWNEKAEK